MPRGRVRPGRRVALACAAVVLCGCGQGAIDAPPARLPTPVVAMPPVGHEDKIIALERRDAALSAPAMALTDSYPAEIAALLAAWSALLERTRGTAYEGYCVLRVEQLQQRREELAKRQLDHLIYHDVAVLVREGKWDLARAAFAKFAEQNGTALSARLVHERAEFESRVRDIPMLFDWRIEFKERVGAGDLVGASFRRHDPALAIVVAEATDHAHGRLRLVRSGKSALEFSCALETVPGDADWRMSIGATTSFGLSHSTCTLRINGRTVFAGWTVADDMPNTYFWPVGEYLVTGENRIRLTLDREARTVLTLLDVGLIGRR